MQVPDEILIERVVGRRLDPETGKIYHLKYFPPPEEIVGRLMQRSDDNKEAVGGSSPDQKQKRGRDGCGPASLSSDWLLSGIFGTRSW